MASAHLSKALFEVVRLPSLAPECAAQAFVDLYWKAQALIHHVVRIWELQHEEEAELSEFAANLLEVDPAWLVIAQTPKALLRFEFDAFLGALYSHTNTLTRAMKAYLSGHDEKSSSFRTFEKWLQNNCRARWQEVARNMLGRYREFAVGTFRDFAKKGSSRDLVAHGQVLRCRPIQVARDTSIPLRVDRFVGPDVQVSGATGFPRLKATTQSAEGLASYLAIVRRVEVDVETGVSSHVLITPSGEEGSPTSFGNRAQLLAADLFRFTAILIGLVEPASAVERVKAAEEASFEMVRGRLKASGLQEKREIVGNHFGSDIA